MKLIDETTKGWLKLMLPSIVTVLIIMLLLYIIPNKTPFIMATIIMIVTQTKMLIDKIVKQAEVDYESIVKNIAITPPTVFIFYYALLLLTSYGVIGLIIIVLGFAGWKMWRNRKIMLDGMRHIETKVFGEPLDKKKNTRKE